MTSRIQNRDIVVIGASAGGVQALSKLVSLLPAEFPASVLLVLHTTPDRASPLPEILTGRGRLQATHAVHGEQLLTGRIYVAPPDNHLMVRPGYFHVVRGPKENGQRPSVDALFRTAASAYGSRVIGVVLTGYLDCGTAGMLSIKARGGVGVVQDPSDAEVPDMPQSAIGHANVDHVAPLHEIPALLARLVAEPAGEAPALQSPGITELEDDAPGMPIEIVCPACQGALSVVQHAKFESFRCHVGHRFSLQGLAVEQAESVERALWAATRALEESASVLRRAAAYARGDIRTRLADKEETQVQYAELIREMLLRWGVMAPADAPTGAELAGARRGKPH